MIVNINLEGEMKISKEDFARKLVELFPEKAEALKQHYEDYGELLGHVFFSEEINVPLFDMLLESANGDEISKYCGFVEEMWQNGADEVVNVVDVTILERLSDDETVWKNFGKNVSNEFKRYINEDLLINNTLMTYNVKKLEYTGS